MRYRLRTLLILLAVAPPIIECGWHVAVWRTNHRLGRRLDRDNAIKQLHFTVTLGGWHAGPCNDDVDLFELYDAEVARRNQNKR